MIDIPLTKTDETSRTITFEWTPMSCAGYVFYVNNIRVANSWNSFKNTVRFNKVPDAIYKVDAVEVIARGTYPSSSTPTNSEDYSKDPYSIGMYSK